MSSQHRTAAWPCALLAATAIAAPPQGGASAPAAPAASSPPPAAAVDAMPATGQRLTVKITGNGTPIANAEVRIRFAAGGNTTLRTGDDGTVRISAPPVGKVTVRVLAEGWNLGQGQIVVAHGKPNTLSIALKQD